MADPKEKNPLSTDIAQDVINEALESVERRAAESEHGVALDIDGEAPSRAQFSELTEEVTSLRAQLEFSQAKGREMMDKIKDSHERALRSAADLDNYKKRAQKEREEVQKFGAEKLLKDLLPVVDNLDRALEAGEKSPDFLSFQKGVAMTRKLFEDALGRHGVKGFSARGQAFDPRLHEAMQQVETNEVPVGHVAGEILRGYMLNDRLVRPALVSVARAAAGSEFAAEPSTQTAPEVPAEGAGEGP